MLPFIEFGALRISSYLFMAALAFLASTLLVLLRRKSQNIAAWEALSLSCTTLIGGAAGAKIFHLAGRVMQGEAFWTARFWLSARLSSGYIWYGGVVGAFIFLLLYAKIRKMPLKKITDLMTPFALLFNAIARFGCLLAGCCFGARSTWGLALYGVTRFPSPVFESALCLIILVIILVWKPERKRPGILLPLFLITYSAGRFVLEFYRGDASRGAFLLFSTSQWFALLIMLATAIMVMRKRRERK